MRNALDRKDPLISVLLAREESRQRNGIELIASENFTSAAVMAAVGSALTNKYAEGYPGKRYYGGCEEAIDPLEIEIMDRGNKLFGSESMNVQPHDGSGANRAMYRAAGLRASRPQDLNRDVLVSLGANVEHLTHGKSVNASGQDYEVHHYGLLPETLAINIDEAAKIAAEHKGRMKVLMLGHSAYPKMIPEEVFAKLADIAHQNGAKFVVDMAHFAGLVAGGAHPSPVPYADYVSSTSHKTLRGPRAGFVISKKADEKDLRRAVFPELQGGPHMHVIAGKGVAFGEALEPEFRTYAAQIVTNTRALADRLRSNGLSVVGGREDANHLFLVDVTANGGPTGKIAEKSLDKGGITVNKNMLIPSDPRKPLDPSAIRVGTPAMTTRGMGPSEMVQIADWMTSIIRDPNDTSLQSRTRDAARELTTGFPLPHERDEEDA